MSSLALLATPLSEKKQVPPKTTFSASQGAQQDAAGCTEVHSRCSSILHQCSCRQLRFITTVIAHFCSGGFNCIWSRLADCQPQAIADGSDTIGKKLNGVTRNISGDQCSKLFKSKFGFFLYILCLIRNRALPGFVVACPASLSQFTALPVSFASYISHGLQRSSAKSQLMTVSRRKRRMLTPRVPWRTMASAPSSLCARLAILWLPRQGP